jgi:AAA family ATP:ADP antiporter
MTRKDLEEHIKRVLRLAFDIRAGEYERALLMQLNIFLVVLSLLIVKPVVQALFLSNVGVKQLPVVFVLVAAAAMLVSTVYARNLNRIPLKNIMNGTIGTAVAAQIVLVVLLFTGPWGVWIYYAFYIATAIFGVVATSQVWILANLVFTNREAARLFGFIGAGAIAGGITGGYLTSLLAPVIGGGNLVLVSAFLLSGCIPVTSYTWRNHVANLNVLQQRKRLATFGDHPIRLIRNSKHLMYLASIVGVGVIVAKLVDYQFSALAVRNIRTSDDLASFFGFWFSTFNVISLGIQLFLTRRIVGVYGVGVSLFLLPATLLFGATLLLLFPVLAVGVFMKAADVTLKQSVNKSATELLVLPLPATVKYQTKSFIDVFVDSAATGIGGLLLIFMVSGLDLSVQFTGLLILPLAALWIYFAVGVRREYVNTFRRKLADQLDRGQQREPLPDPTSILEGLRRVLQEGAERQRLYVLRKIREEHEDRLVADIIPLLRHESPALRAGALEALYVFHSPDLSDDVAPMVEDSSRDVQVRAMEYLIGHAGHDRVAVLDRYLQHEDDVVNLAALIGVAVESRNNPEMMKLFRLEQRLHDKLHYLGMMDDSAARLRYERAIIRAIGRANLVSFYDRLESYLSSPHPELVEAALIAAGMTSNSRFTPALCLALGRPDVRDAAITGLAESGKGVFAELSRLMSENALPVEVVRQLPRVAERIPEQEAVSFLLELTAHEDITVQIEALRTLNSLKLRNPHLVIEHKNLIALIVRDAGLYLDTLAVLYAETHRGSEDVPSVADARRSLVALLERRLDVILERIFRLLGLKYPPEEILPIYEGIQSRSTDLRTNSVEYLDSLLFGNLKKAVLPIVETALLDSVTEETIRSLKIEIPDQQACFRMLLHSRDVKLKQAVLFLIEQLNDPAYLALVQAFTTHPNPKVRDFAVRAERAITGAG